MEVACLVSILTGSVPVRVTNAMVDAILTKNNMEDKVASSDIDSLHRDTAKSKLDLVSAVKSDDAQVNGKMRNSYLVAYQGS
eukprot:13338463-Ditylum_brightwellii.AAC.1